MFSKTDYDVVIVGSGPCGSAAGMAAAKAGASVLILERKKDIGSPCRCGEGIGQHWVDEFEMKIADKCISSKINGAALYAPNNKTELVVKNKESKGYVLNRKVFDLWLAEQAGREGAEISVKSEVLDVTKDGGRVSGVVVERDGKQERITSKVLIAADGGESTIARMAGINSTAALYDTDFGLEYEMVNVPCKDLIEIYFTNKYAPRGYVWIFPKGKDTANVGVGIGGHCKPYAKKYLDAWIKEVGGERLKHAQPMAMKGGIIPVGAPMKDLVLDGFMVAGTAAHQVDPIHGGGISLAMDAGYIAGKVAGKCSKSGKCEKSALSEYERTWRQTREAKLLKRLLLRKVLEQLNDEDLNAIFQIIDTHGVENLLTGDYAPVAKDIIAKRPQFIKVLGALLK